MYLLCFYLFYFLLFMKLLDIGYLFHLNNSNLNFKFCTVYLVEMVEPMVHDPNKIKIS